MTEFVRYPDPRLTRSATTRPIDDALRATGERLLAATASVQAFGLAAAHIGEIEPLVVISVAGDASQRDYRVLFNPQIMAVAEAVHAGPEGSRCPGSKHRSSARSGPKSPMTMPTASA
ncbi:MAG: peptide deformylase [Devosia sp.]